MNICGNRLDADLADDLLVDEACPQGQMILLKPDEVSDIRVCCYCWFDEFKTVDVTAVKVVVLRDIPHLVLAEYERDIPMVPPPPHCGRNEACEICEFFS